MKLEPGLQLTGQWVWVVYIVISFNFSRSFAHVYWEPARCRSQREVFIRLKGGIPDMLLGRMWTVFHKKLKTPCLCPQLGSFLAWIWAERYFSHQKGSHQTPLRCCSRAENAGWAGLAGGLGPWTREQEWMAGPHSRQRRCPAEMQAWPQHRLRSNWPGHRGLPAVSECHRGGPEKG